MSPILPENKHRYPPDWDEIRARILERAGSLCEFCGVKNYAVGVRDPSGAFHPMSPAECDEAAADGERVFRIVLTIAHLDHTPENNDPSNLKALCQRCHNRYDQPHRKATRRRVKGQCELFSREIA